MSSPSESSPTPASAPIRVAVTGPLVISTAAEWHRQLLAAISDASALELDLSGVTQLDVFGLQLLCAAGRTSTEAGIRLTITGASAAALEAADAAGFPPSTLHAQ